MSTAFAVSFEQGAYQSFGSEMSELRAWVLAQLLWNPVIKDDKRLIREFLEGYYGPKPARSYGSTCSSCPMPHKAST